MQAPVLTPENRAFGHDGHVFAVLEELQCAGKLIGLLHSSPHGPTPNQYDHIASLERARMLAFGCRDGFFFSGEYASRTGLSIDAIGVDDAWVDGCRFDDGTIRANVSSWKANGAG